jgi:PAS domain S-box-containing protein
LTWNAGAERLYGYSATEAQGQPMAFLLPRDRVDEELEILRRINRGERVDQVETVRLRKDGRQIHVSLTISPIRDRTGEIVAVSHIAREINERTRAEDSVRDAEAKLRAFVESASQGIIAIDAAGRIDLANAKVEGDAPYSETRKPWCFGGGCRARLNNLLTAIMGNATLALQAMPPTSPDHLLIKEIVHASKAAADLTRQLLAYAGKGRFVVEAIDLSRLVRDISALVQSSIPKKVQLRLSLADNLPPSRVDASQIQQVVMNLIINAGEAIAENVGTILLTTERQEVDDRYCEAYFFGALEE